MASSITDATTKVHAILEPLTSDERRRVVQAVLTLLGDDVSIRMPTAAGQVGQDTDEQTGSTSFHSKANPWMKKHGLSSEQLEQYFHFDDGTVTCISHAGNGQAMREKTIHSYLLQGVAALLTNGEAEFSDDEARSLCTHFGCYDKTNHATHLKSVGNLMTGSKASGWKLTAPGLAEAAKILKS